MLKKKSGSRSLAVVVATGALAAAFVVVPAIATPAFASDSSTATSLFADLNTKRTSSGVAVAAVAPNGFANIAAAGLAKLYSGSTHPCASNSSYPPPSSPVVADTNTVICTSVATGSQEASRLLAKMESIISDADVLNAGLGIYTNAGVGVYTKGSKVYAAIDMLGYTSAPYGYLAFKTPTVTGTAKVGHTLTVSYNAAVPDNGSTTGISYDIQWMAQGVGEVGTGNTYAVSASAVGHTVEAYVAASKSGFVQHTVISAPTAAVKKGTFAFDGSSTKVIQIISGLTPHGVDVTPSAGATYQWYRGSTAIPSADSIIYDPTTSDIGHQLSVKVTWSLSGYTTVERTYKTASHFAGLNFIATAAPTLSFSGSAPEVGQTITSTSTGWNPDASFVYSWKLNGTTISGQHGSSLVVTHSMIGKKITVTYKGSSSTYVTTSRTSAATPKVIS